jgi:hypothetical protein
MIKKILFAVIFTVAVSSSQTIHDLIPPINLYQNQTTKVLISDLFYAEDYSVEFLPSEIVEVGYDVSTKEISLTPKSSFYGMGLVSFKLNS